MKFTNYPNIYALVLLVLLAACSNSGSGYSALARKEMASGVIKDSLLFNLKLGQSKEFFLQACWQLNQKGIISEGPGSRTVKYELPNQEGNNEPTGMTLLFFGDFNDENIMTGMDMSFYYNAWSIWNKSLQADQLLPVVRDTLMKWYPGNNFIKVPLSQDGPPLLVKVDGNRRIIIKPLEDNRMVNVKIDDLRYVLDAR
ncbi:hypothetical protein [Maribacter sp. 2307ULW6-5]|uniref:hypothetical protein n=1 Tax=Maribacter sp. 2307ULW6-5 TaxID=3386275 RepID=UPI0039BD22EA